MIIYVVDPLGRIRHGVGVGKARPIVRGEGRGPCDVLVVAKSRGGTGPLVVRR